MTLEFDIKHFDQHNKNRKLLNFHIDGMHKTFTVTWDYIKCDACNLRLTRESADKKMHYARAIEIFKKDHECKEIK